MILRVRLQRDNASGNRQGMLACSLQTVVCRWEESGSLDFKPVLLHERNRLLGRAQQKQMIRCWAVNRYVDVHACARTHKVADGIKSASRLLQMFEHFREYDRVEPWPGVPRFKEI